MAADRRYVLEFTHVLYAAKPDLTVLGAQGKSGIDVDKKRVFTCIAACKAFVFLVAPVLTKTIFHVKQIGALVHDIG